MSEVTREEMLARIDKALIPIKTGDIEWNPSQEDQILLKAIRRLIEKVGEWQLIADGILKIEPIEFENDEDFYSWMQEIRDFGKEAADGNNKN